MPGRTGRILLRVVLVVTMTAAALVAAELLARFQFRRAQSSGRAGDFIARRGGGPSYRSNSLGFRDREVPPKSPDRYRIAVIGDSFAWGQGVEERDRFSNLLEEFLGPRYEVFNFGRPVHSCPGLPWSPPAIWTCDPTSRCSEITTTALRPRPWFAR